MPRSKSERCAGLALALLLSGAFAGTRLAPAAQALNTANTASGAALYRSCAACHGQRGEGLTASKAPALAGLPAWYVDRQLGNFLTGVRGATPDDTEGAQMRAASSALQSEAQRASVAAYVAGLPRPNARPRPPADAAALANGRNYFNALCSACHGANGMGNQSLGAPPLASATADYLLRQFAAFKSGRRGAHPQDKPGAQMRAIAAMLPDARTERDVIAYAAGLGS